MKKLMMLAAVACAAIGAEAASVTWGSINSTTGGKTFLVDKTGAQIGKSDFASLGVNFVLVALSGDALTAYQNGTYSAAYDASAVLSTGAISSSTKAAMKGSFSTDLKFTYGETNPIKDGDYLAVVITDGKTMMNITYADGTKVTDSYLVNGLADNLWTGTGNQPFNFATKGNFTADVPEPTSSLLMLLGVAGLALRRRRA